MTIIIIVSAWFDMQIPPLYYPPFSILVSLQTIKSGALQGQLVKIKSLKA